MSFFALLALLLGVRITISDLYARRVPNAWLAGTLGCVALGTVVAALTGAPLPGASHLLAALVGLLALLPFHLVGWMGAGDVKYFAVLGLLLGLPALLPVWIAASVLAGAHVACVICLPRLSACLPPRVLLLRARVVAHWHLQPAALQMRHAREGRIGIPFAAYLAVASIAWVLTASTGAAG